MNRTKKWLLGVLLLIAMALPALGCGNPVQPLIDQDPTTHQPTK